MLILWASGGAVVGGGEGSAPPTAVLPSLPALEFDIVRTTRFATDVQKAVSGKTTRMGMMRWPRVTWSLSFSLLRDDGSVALSELRLLVGFFNSLRGRVGTFYYTDPTFNTVAAMRFSTGDGTTKVFQLTATYQANPSSPGTPEIIQNLNGVPALQDNGSTIDPATYSISATGVVTFVTAPALGHNLNWSGSFYYLCMFDEDRLNFSEFMNNWWELKVLRFSSVIR